MRTKHTKYNGLNLILFKALASRVTPLVFSAMLGVSVANADNTAVAKAPALIDPACVEAVQSRFSGPLETAKKKVRADRGSINSALVALRQAVQDCQPKLPANQDSQDSCAREAASRAQDALGTATRDYAVDLSAQLSIEAQIQAADCSINPKPGPSPSPSPTASIDSAEQQDSPEASPSPSPTAQPLAISSEGA